MTTGPWHPPCTWPCATCLAVSVRSVPQPSSRVGNQALEGEGTPTAGWGRGRWGASLVQTSLGGAGTGAGTESLPMTASERAKVRAGQAQGGG